jgi:hypothetical protein
MKIGHQILLGILGGLGDGMQQGIVRGDKIIAEKKKRDLDEKKHNELLALKKLQHAETMAQRRSEHEDKMRLEVLKLLKPQSTGTGGSGSGKGKGGEGSDVGGMNDVQKAIFKNLQQIEAKTPNAVGQDVMGVVAQYPDLLTQSDIFQPNPHFNEKANQNGLLALVTGKGGQAKKQKAYITPPINELIARGKALNAQKYAKLGIAVDDDGMPIQQPQQPQPQSLIGGKQMVSPYTADNGNGGQGISLSIGNQTITITPNTLNATVPAVQQQAQQTVQPAQVQPQIQQPQQHSMFHIQTADERANAPDVMANVRKFSEEADRVQKENKRKFQAQNLDLEVTKNPFKTLLAAGASSASAATYDIPNALGHHVADRAKKLSEYAGQHMDDKNLSDRERQALKITRNASDAVVKFGNAIDAYRALNPNASGLTDMLGMLTGGAAAKGVGKLAGKVAGKVAGKKAAKSAVKQTAEEISKHNFAPSEKQIWDQLNRDFGKTGKVQEAVGKASDTAQKGYTGVKKAGTAVKNRYNEVLPNGLTRTMLGSGGKAVKYTAGSTIAEQAINPERHKDEPSALSREMIPEYVSAGLKGAGLGLAMRAAGNIAAPKQTIKREKARVLDQMLDREIKSHGLDDKFSLAEQSKLGDIMRTIKGVTIQNFSEMSEYIGKKLTDMNDRVRDNLHTIILGKDGILRKSLEQSILEQEAKVKGKYEKEGVTLNERFGQATGKDFTRPEHYEKVMKTPKKPGETPADPFEAYAKAKAGSERAYEELKSKSAEYKERYGNLKNETDIFKDKEGKLHYNPKFDTELELERFRHNERQKYYTTESQKARDDLSAQQKAYDEYTAAFRAKEAKREEAYLKRKAKYDKAHAEQPASYEDFYANAMKAEPFAKMSERRREKLAKEAFEKNIDIKKYAEDVADVTGEQMSPYTLEETLHNMDARPRETTAKKGRVPNPPKPDTAGAERIRAMEEMIEKSKARAEETSANYEKYKTPFEETDWFKKRGTKEEIERRYNESPYKIIDEQRAKEAEHLRDLKSQISKSNAEKNVLEQFKNSGFEYKQVKHDDGRTEMVITPKPVPTDVHMPLKTIVDRFRGNNPNVKYKTSLPPARYDIGTYENYAKEIVQRHLGEGQAKRLFKYREDGKFKNPEANEVLYSPYVMYETKKKFAQMAADFYAKDNKVDGARFYEMSEHLMEDLQDMLKHSKPENPKYSFKELVKDSKTYGSMQQVQSMGFQEFANTHAKKMKQTGTPEDNIKFAMSKAGGLSDLQRRAMQADFLMKVLNNVEGSRFSEGNAGKQFIAGVPQKRLFDIMFQNAKARARVQKVVDFGEAADRATMMYRRLVRGSDTAKTMGEGMGRFATSTSGMRNTGIRTIWEFLKNTEMGTGVHGQSIYADLVKKLFNPNAQAARAYIKKTANRKPVGAYARIWSKIRDDNFGGLQKVIGTRQGREDWYDELRAGYRRYF